MRAPMFWEQDPDTYAYEEEQERRALTQGLHQPMKAWYNGDDATKIKERFGAFPMFWQDLLTWEHSRLVQKMYLKFVDTGAGATSLLQMIDEQQQQQAEQETEAAPQEDGVVGDGVPTQNGDAREVMEEAQQQPQQENGEDQSVASQATETTQSAEEEKDRKKRSRWGEPQKKSRWGGTPTDTADGGEKKKTRWSQPAPGTVEAAQQAQAQQPMLTQEQIQEIIVLQLRMEGIAKKMLTVAQDALAKENDPDKTPSPPPVYDANGKRLNTREVRMGEALKKERNDVIEKLIKLNPLYRPPSDYVRPKPFRKLYIPQNEYPQYNFIGLIIGPRGNTQKRMERETNTKIAIRGKGSIKEGARGKDRHKHADDEHDELHVLVQGETEEEVEASAKMIADLLVPVEDDNNEHKQKQLRELALINGTLREEEYCNICGEKGHRQFECPHRHTKVKTVQVKCAICGDTSHPTRDCAQRKQPETAQHKEQLDQEYLNFMMELGEAPPPGMGPPPSSSSLSGPPPSGPPPAAGHPSPSRPPPPATSAPLPAPRPTAPQPYRPAPPTNPPPPRTSYPPRNTSYPPSSYGAPPPSYPPSTSSYGPPPPPPPPPTSYPPPAYPSYYSSYPPTYSYPYPGYDYSSYGPPPPPPPNPGQSQHNGPSVPPPPPPPPQA